MTGCIAAEEPAAKESVTDHRRRSIDMYSDDILYIFWNRLYAICLPIQIAYLSLFGRG